MAQFRKVKALDLALVLGQFIQAMLFFLLLVRLRVSRVDICSQDKVFSTFSVFLALFLLLFLIAGLFRGLHLVLGSRCFELLGFGLRFLRSRVFYWVALGISPSGVGSVVAQTLLVHLSDLGVGLQAYLGLDIDCFFDNLGSTVYPSASLLHLSSYWWPKAFAEKTYQIGLFGRPGIVKFE